MTTPTRCAIYLRVSSEAQASGQFGRFAEADDERYGLTRQRANCEAYASKMGWQVVKVYTDAHTGTELWERDALTELRQDFSKDLFDVLLVDSLDRLSRKIYHQGLIFSEAEHHGVRWDSATEDIDHSPEGRMLQTIISAFAEVEREKIIMRTRGGLRERVKSGKLPPMAKPKFGYLWADEKKTKFILHPEQSETVRLIYDLCLSGMTQTQIKHELERRGRSSGDGPYWWPSGIHRILTDHTYKGEFYANKWITSKVNGKKQLRERPQEDWILIPDGAPAIVTPQEWDMAQYVMKQRKKSASRNAREPYTSLLRGGSLICFNCGGTITTGTLGSKNRNRVYKHATDTARYHGCPQMGIYQEPIDNAVWDQIVSTILNRENIERELAASQSEDTLERELDLALSQVEKLRTQHKRATERFLLMDDDLAAETGNVMIQNLAKQIKQGELDIATLTERRQEREASHAALEGMASTIEQFEANLKLVTPKQKQDLIRALDVKVRLYPNDHDPRWEGTFRLTPYSMQTATLSSEKQSLITVCGLGYCLYFPLRSP